jgi:2'-5' RNA ligase
VNEPLLRLFFALPCPTDDAARIDRWRAGCRVNGKPVRASNLHITLVFLGAQPAERLPQLKQLAASITAPCFELSLDRLDLWPEGLLHLAPNRVPNELLQLASQLRQKLEDAGFIVEPRRYQPHLTLARQSGLPELTTAPDFHWTVSEFSLFSSEQGAQGLHYRVLDTWQLH